MLACPVCKTALNQDDEGGTVVDTCAKHGVWLDKKELFDVTEKQRREGTGRDWKSLFTRLKRPGGDPHRMLACPHCGDAMTIERYHDVQIDRCEAHGVWLDAGELDAILHNLSLDSSYMDGIALRLSDLKY